MTDIGHIVSTTWPRIRESARAFRDPLQMVRVVKRDAFDTLSADLRVLAKELKGHEMVPKSLLNEIYQTQQILRNEAPYMKGLTAELEEMANKLENTLAMILVDECHEDRVPGVPRVV